MIYNNTGHAIPVNLKCTEVHTIGVQAQTIDIFVMLLGLEIGTDFTNLIL